MAANEPPKSLADRPFLPLPFTFLLLRVCWWWWRRLLGKLGEWGSRVLAREIEDAFPTRQFDGPQGL